MFKKSRTYFTVVFFLMTTFFWQNATAQVKRIEGNRHKNNEPKNYNLSPKPKKTSEGNSMSQTVQFRPQSIDGMNMLSGLKPGTLDEDGLPLFIEGKQTNAAKNLSNVEKAAAYAEEAKSLMKIKNDDLGFTALDEWKDDLGQVHVKFQQTYRGIPIFGAEIIVHGDQDGFNFLNGRYQVDVNQVDVIPTFTAEQTTEIVKADFPEWQEIGEDLKALYPGKQVNSNLVVFRDGNKICHLAHHMTVYPNIGERWEYFVDAKDGKILDKYPSLCKFHGFGKKWGMACNHEHATTANILESFDGKAEAVAKDLLNVNRLINTYQVGNSYYLIDAARDMFSNQSVLPNEPEGVIWTIDAMNTSPAKSNFRYDHVISSNNTWVNTPGGVSSHYNGGKAFEYFRIVHNRNSIDGNRGNIISLINVADEDGSSMGNAFWNGAAMFYGNGDGAFFPLARGLDVAGHEMSHGVIQNTSNLVYQGESGALNESFADIFGAMIDRDDWLIGEDVVKTGAFPSGALRSMSNPHNGAQTNDFARGWQPKIYSERFLGNEDNGGVHINSGIPNHAFFLFATAVGKEKAERIFYRALSQYMTKSSKFVDCRVAVVKAATDLHGANSPEVTAARKAFTDVGILGDNGGDYENDAPSNPGQEFVLFTNQNKIGLFITNPAGQPVSFGNPLTSREILSKPSISDDGTEIVYVGADNKLYYININWATQQKSEIVLSNEPIWRNAVISKDGLRIAALTDEIDNLIYVYDFTGANVVSNIFELYNPTFSSGVTTDDVLYADAMEFDISGEYIMYDAENEIKSNTSGSITYWDIGFIKVWNKTSQTFALGSVEKLFAALPDESSAVNPTFSKNSPYIIAFDYIEDFVSYLLGTNLETGEIGLIFENEVLGYPTYSPKDNQIKFDNKPGSQFRIARVNVQDNKIYPVDNTAVVWLEGFRWATWFSNGSRVLSSNEETELEQETVFVFPNPASESILLSCNNKLAGSAVLEMFDASGKMVWNQNLELSSGENHLLIPVQNMSNGTYFVAIRSSGKVLATKMVVVQK